MKSFRFKDLMINVGSGGGVQGYGVPVTTQCPGASIHPTVCYTPTDCTHPCSLFSQQLVKDFCPPMSLVFPMGTLGCGPTLLTDRADPAGQSEQLAAVKVQLQEALRQVEVQQRTLEESLQPQTVAEVEELQAKLHEASSELERRKQELQKKPEKNATK